MTITLDVDRQRFTLGSSWIAALKWDDAPEYHQGLRQMPGTKAIDIAGVHIEDPWMVEVKDFRGHHDANKLRMKSGDLADEAADKARDTVAAMVWSQGRGVADNLAAIRAVLKSLLFAPGKINVVLWLEQDRPLDKAMAMSIAGDAWPG